MTTRLWLEFINTESRDDGDDALVSFDAFVAWLEETQLLDEERGDTLRRRSLLQPAGATAALLEARRMRAALRALAQGRETDKAPALALAELNRVLGRSAGMRRIEQLDDGRFVRSFVAAGDAFAGLLIPLVESASDSLVRGELHRIRRCANPSCGRVFYDSSKNVSRRWCTMKECGNRAKAGRFREREKREARRGGERR